MDIKDKNGRVIYTTASESLSEASLTVANLASANLTGANLFDADLTGANLFDADLTGANLTCANLTSASLSDANLDDANLSGANLTGANLTHADLSFANLTYEQLTSANLSKIKADLLSVLNQNRDEAPYLRSAIVEGRIDGTCYEGKCACLIGTIANAKHVNYTKLSLDPERPAERWFLAIREGDTPDKSPIARITLEWVDEFLALP